MTDLADILDRLKREPMVCAGEACQAMLVFPNGSARVIYANRVLSFANAQELAEYAAEDGCEFHI